MTDEEQKKMVASIKALGKSYHDVLQRISKYEPLFQGQDQCSYCQRRRPIIQTPDTELRIIYGNKLSSWIKVGKSVSQNIKFCPMCGRKL
ncbi:hypothetical protein [Loigolactobacillus rennini]|uniref:Uncharacterized protein n=1 Tax=Loigolactobacillus rennini DSM 20253 TaxID=1423796 RepID=A0A0R2D4R0_9LACO|nr:hypothetical protein [Loigolactobacillus rennini]KRM94835.1 hypothetical protein FC24_GL000128 [Loigolactobacillus rennini DSM 20253]